ncbi:MAG TPA: SH3 domain-containing protein [Anaerolineales bacterium]|nr:SH3 domain-containing protein [Anaerolineales bacterium]
MNIRLLLNRWVIGGAILLAGLLVLITAVSIGLTSARQNDEVGFVPADLTMIPAPTSTSSAPATATIDPFAPTPAPTGIAIGNYVQITGTEGEGLRIRAQPGLNGEPQFLGYDEEVFVVQDGPRQVDGFTWWYLVAPYDQTRVGWAAADFLSYIPAP